HCATFKDNSDALLPARSTIMAPRAKTPVAARPLSSFPIRPPTWRLAPLPPSMSSATGLLHPRNRHQGRYDFPRLIQDSPSLSRYVRPNPLGDQSIDFANPAAVKELNR